MNGAGELQLLWGLDTSSPTLIGIALVAALVLALGFWNTRPLADARRRWTLRALRLALLGLLVAAFAEPSLVRELAQDPRRSVAVLIDRSASMGIEGTAARPRWQRAADAVQTLAEHQAIVPYTFDGSLERLRRGVRAAAGDGAATAETGAALEAVSPLGTTTDLRAALTSLAGLDRPVGLSAVAIVSDGIDRGPLAPLGGDDAALDSATLDALEALDVPIHAIHLADEVPVFDLSVEQIRAAGFAFTRTELPVAVDLHIQAHAATDGTFDLRLAENGRLIESRTLPLDGPRRRTETFTVQPQHVGRDVLTAQIVGLPGEATLANNRADVVVDVVRDRIRVLQLAGRPSWDARFLRSALRAAPGVDLVSFYVMVDEEAGLFVQAQDTTLIPFPTRTLFEEALPTFDIVVLQDFGFGPFGVLRHALQLGAYLGEGGAFWVIGGRRSLAAGGYRGTPIGRWMPAVLRPLDAGDDGYRDATAGELLTDVGARHPVTRIADDPDESARLWRALTLPGHNTGLAAREEAATLLKAGDGSPVLALGTWGAGRTALLATSGLWTWAFPDDRAPLPAEAMRRAHGRLLDQLMRWLVRDPVFDDLRLEVPAEPIPQGSAAPIRVVATALDRTPRADVTVDLQVRRLEPPAGAAGTPTAAVRKLRLQTDERGEVDASIGGLDRGAYEIVATARIDGHDASSRAPLVVGPATRELLDLSADDRVLRALTEASGGELLQRAPSAPLPARSRVEAGVAIRVRTELWSRPELWLVLVGLLGLEWWLRRRWGLA